MYEFVFLCTLTDYRYYRKFHNSFCVWLSLSVFVWVSVISHQKRMWKGPLMFNLNILKYTIDHVELFYKPRKKMKKNGFFFLSSKNTKWNRKYMLDRQMDRINNVKLVMKIMDNKKNVHFRFTKDTQGQCLSMFLYQ